MKKNSKINYTCLDYVHIRKPLLSLSIYKKLFIDKNVCQQNELLELIEQTSLLKNSIQISSPSLYTNLYKNNAQIHDSLVKYIIRSTTRATPYCFFSGVNNANLFLHDYESSIELNKNHPHTPHYLPDTQWIFLLSKKIESNWDIVIHLNLIINNTVMEKKKNIINYSFLGLYKDSKSNSSKCNNTQLTKIILQNTKSPIKFEKLYKIILSNCDDSIQPINIFNFLINLIKKEILLTDIFPPFDSSNKLDYIIKKIENIPAASIYHNQLLNLQNCFNAINFKEVDDQNKMIEIIILRMKKIVQSDNYLDCKLTNNYTKFTIPKNNLLQLQDLTNFIANISSKIEYNHYNEFKKNFIEEFGTSREIPLTLLFDDNYRYLLDYLFIKEDQFNDQLSLKITSVLYQLYSDAVKNNSNINLENLLKGIKKMLHESKVCNIMDESVEFFCITSQFEEGNIYLLPWIGTNTVGKTSGRFNDILTDKKYHQNIDCIATQLCKKNYLPLNINFNSKNSRLMNLLYQKNEENEFFETLNINSFHNEYLPSNILIGLNNSRKLYLKDKLTNKIIFPFTLNNINIEVEPLLSKILNKLSDFTSPLILLNLINKKMSIFKYRPRIIFKDIVVYPQTWVIDHDDYNFINEDMLVNYLINLTSQNYIYVKDRDNRLLLNLFNQDHKKILFNLYKNKTTLIINEVEDIIIKSFNENNDGNIYEYIVPFALNDNENHLNTQTKHIKENESLRKLTIGDGCLSINIYAEKHNFNIITNNYLSPFIDDLTINKQLDLFFFIKYKDIKNHIRLRMFSQNDMRQVIQKTINFLDKLLSSEVITDYQIVSYNREIERYGGSDLINTFENVFMYDSLYALDFLKSKNTDIDYLFGCIQIIQAFDINFQNIYELLDFIPKDSYRNKYKKIKNEIFELTLNKNYCISDTSFEKLISMINIYSKKIDSSSYRDNKRNIILSILHMHCNRIYGTDRGLEREYLSILRHFSYDYYRYTKYNKANIR